MQAAYQEEFLIVASCTAPVLNAPGDEVLVQGVPLVASTTFHMVRASLHTLDVCRAQPSTDHPNVCGPRSIHSQ